MKKIRDKLKQLLFSDSNEEFFKLVQLLSDTSTVESITELLLTLDDDYDYYDEMNTLMHAVERADVTIVYEATISNLEQLNAQAPEWCETIIKRHLNAVGGISDRFDAFKFIEMSKGSPSAYSVMKVVATDLLDKNKIPEIIRQEL